MWVKYVISLCLTLLVCTVHVYIIIELFFQENFKYEVQEKSPANQAITMQQLAEEYWR
jgi:hypothetical protein